MTTFEAIVLIAVANVLIVGMVVWRERMASRERQRLSSMVARDMAANSAALKMATCSR
jgi:hypothetical protein